MRFVALLLFALSSVIAIAAEPHPSLPPPVIPDCLGVNIHFTDPKPGELEMLTSAGFQWVRMDFGWGGTERKKGEYDFSAYDRLVAALDQHKLRAVFILDYGNPLYSDPGDKQPFTSRVDTDEFRQAFARWAVAAVRHFKGHGYLWEMWNEPNGDGFWKPKANVGQYVALARATGEALRGTGLLGSQGEAFIGPTTSTIDLPYLEACFKAGLLEFWDAVSVHPYRQQAPESAAEEYRTLRLLIRKYAPKDKVIPVVSGEWGYSTAYPAFAGKSGLERDAMQAQYIAREFLTNISNDVALSIWYDWHDDGTNPKDAEHRFGIVEHDYHAGRDPVYDPKPAWVAVKTLTEQLGGFRFNKELAFVDIQQQHPLLFTKADEVRVAIWGIPRVAELDWLPASPGTFSSVDYLGHMQPTLKAEGKTNPKLELRIGNAPLYLRPDAPNDLLRLAAAWQRMPLEIPVEPDKPQAVRHALRNPLDHAVVIGVGSNRELTLNPRAEFADRVPVLPTREASVVGSYGLLLPGLARLEQRVRYVSTAPLRILPCPVSARQLYVRMENPTGAAFGGQIRVTTSETPKVGVVDVVEPESAQAVQVNFAVDEREKIVALPLKRVPGNSYGVDLAFEESGSLQTASASAVYRRVTLDTGDSAHAIAYGAVADGDPKSPSHQEVKEGLPVDPPPYIDSTAFTLHYGFSEGWKFLSLTRSEIPWPSITGVPKKFGMWLHGDAKGCQARIRFTDSTGQSFQSDGPKIDWNGWRFVTFPMSSIDEKRLAHWGGAKDGVIHYPIKWDAIFLLDNVSRQAVEGEIYFSAPTLIY